MPVTKTSVSVSFVLKEPKIHLNADIMRDETLIVFRVSSGRKINKRFSTGFKINPKYWDKSKQKVRNVAAVPNRLEINSYLESLKNDFNRFIVDRISKGENITKLVIKDVYDAISNKGLVGEGVEEKMTFFKYCDLFLENKEKMLPKKRRGKSETVGVYKQAIKHIEGFQNDEGFKVDFESIDLEFYFEFVEYMQTKEKKDGGSYSANTIGKHIKTLKTILNASVYDGFNSNLKFKHPEFKIIKELTTAIFLNNEDLQHIFELDLSKYPKHEKVRDIFIIGCETGQRVSDYNNLSDFPIIKHKGEDYFKIKQKKTENTVLCNVTPAIRHIMNKRYNSLPPTRMSEQDINECIKEVGQMAEINEDVLFERTEGGEKVKRTIPKYKLISSHTARRSFATNKYNAGMNVNDIAELTGHKSTREFLKYIREDGKEIADRIVKAKEFKNSYLKVV